MNTESTSTATATATTSTKSDGKLSKEDLLRRRNKNRLNARRSRERKRLVMDTLQQEHWQMTQANQKIKDENSSLRAAIAAIKQLKESQSSSSSSHQGASNADDARVGVPPVGQKEQQHVQTTASTGTQSSLPSQQHCSTAIQQLQTTGTNNGTTNPAAHQATTMTPLLSRSAAMLHAQNVLRERQSNRSQVAEPPAPPSTPVDGPLASYWALQAMQQQVAAGAPTSILQPAALNNLAVETLNRQVQPALGLLSNPTLLQQISFLAQAAVAQSGSPTSAVPAPDLAAAAAAAAAISAFSVLLQSQMGQSAFSVPSGLAGQQAHHNSSAQFSFPAYPTTQQAQSSFQSASRVSSESDQDDTSRSCTSPEL